MSKFFPNKHGIQKKLGKVLFLKTSKFTYIDSFFTLSNREPNTNVGPSTIFENKSPTNYFLQTR